MKMQNNLKAKPDQFAVFGKKISQAYKKIIAAGTATDFSVHFNAKLKGTNRILLLLFVLVGLGLGCLSLYFWFSAVQWMQAALGLVVGLCLFYLHFKQRFVQAEWLFSATLLLAVVGVQVFYVISPFSLGIFLVAAGCFHYNYGAQLKRTAYFMLLLMVLTTLITYLNHTGLLQPYFHPKSKVFDGNFTAFLSLLLGVLFFVVNARIYQNEMDKAIKGRLYIKRNKRTIALEEQDILFLKADRNYVEIHMANGNRWIEKQTLTSLSQKLNPADFIQIHKSFWVNKNRISSYDKKQVEVADKKLPLGRKFKPLIHLSN